MKNIEFNTDNVDISKIIMSRIQFIVEFLKPLNEQSIIFGLIFGCIIVASVVMVFYKTGFISRIDNEAISPEPTIEVLEILTKPSIEISEVLTKPTEVFTILTKPTVVLEILTKEELIKEELIKENEEILQKAIREEEFLKSGFLNMMENLQNIFKSSGISFDQDNINSVIQLSSASQKISNEENNARSVETLMQEKTKIEQNAQEVKNTLRTKFLEIIQTLKFHPYIENYIAQQIELLFSLEQKNPINEMLSEMQDNNFVQNNEIINKYINYLQFEAIKFITKYIKKDKINVIKNKYLDHDVMEKIRIEELETDQKYNATKLLEEIKQQNAITQQAVESIRKNFTLRFACIISTLTHNDFQENCQKEDVTDFIQDFFTSEPKLGFLSEKAETVIAKTQFDYLKSEFISIIETLKYLELSSFNEEMIDHIQNLQFDTNKKVDDLYDTFIAYITKSSCSQYTKDYILRQIRDVYFLPTYAEKSTIIKLSEFTEDQKTQIADYIKYLQCEAIKLMERYIDDEDIQHNRLALMLAKWLLTPDQRAQFRYFSSAKDYNVGHLAIKLELKNLYFTPNKMDIINTKNIIDELKSKDPAVQKLAESYRRSFTLGFVSIMLKEFTLSNYDFNKTDEVISVIQNLFTSGFQFNSEFQFNFLKPEESESETSNEEESQENKPEAQFDCPKSKLMQQAQFGYILSEFMKIVEVLGFKLSSYEKELILSFHISAHHPSNDASKDIYNLLKYLIKCSQFSCFKYTKDYISQQIDALCSLQTYAKTPIITKISKFTQLHGSFYLKTYAQAPIIAKLSEFTKKEKRQIADYIKYLQFEAVQFIKRYIEDYIPRGHLVLALGEWILTPIQQTKYKAKKFSRHYEDYNLKDLENQLELDQYNKIDIVNIIDQLKSKGPAVQKLAERYRRSFTLGFIDVLNREFTFFNLSEDNVNKSKAVINNIQNLFTSEPKFGLLSEKAETVIAKTEFDYFKSEFINIIETLEYLKLSSSNESLRNKIEKLEFDTDKVDDLYNAFSKYIDQSSCSQYTKDYIIQQIDVLFSLPTYTKIPTVTTLSDLTKKEEREIADYIKYLQSEAIKFIGRYIKIEEQDYNYTQCGCTKAIDWLFATNYMKKSQDSNYNIKDLAIQLELNADNNYKDHKHAARSSLRNNTEARKLAANYRRFFTLGFVCAMDAINDNCFKEEYTKHQAIASIQNPFSYESHLGFYADHQL